LYVQPAREASAPVAERKQFRCERGRAAAQIARAAVERVDTQLARHVDRQWIARTRATLLAAAA